MTLPTPLAPVAPLPLSDTRQVEQEAAEKFPPMTGNAVTLVEPTPERGMGRHVVGQGLDEQTLPRLAEIIHNLQVTAAGLASQLARPEYAVSEVFTIRPLQDTVIPPFSKVVIINNDSGADCTFQLVGGFTHTVPTGATVAYPTLRSTRLTGISGTSTAVFSSDREDATVLNGTTL